MFICEITGRVSELGQALNKVVAAKREKVYTRWVKDEDTNYWQEVPAGTGWEIVRELSLSPEGTRLWESWSDADKQLFLKTR